MEIWEGCEKFCWKMGGGGVRQNWRDKMTGIIIVLIVLIVIIVALSILANSKHPA